VAVIEPVIQMDVTGCAIASAAALVGLSYSEARDAAASAGIRVDDPELWCGTAPMRRLLRALGVGAGRETPFTGWESLPDRALLSVKWHLERGRPCWHWVVFVRGPGGEFVLDSRRALKRHVRTDFGRMKPKWFIEVRGGRLCAPCP
jgi:hypothetical protein